MIDTLDALHKRFPSLYPERGFYFEVSPGWLALLIELSEKLVEIQANHPRVKVQAAQVKSKFGSLRFYFDVLPIAPHRASKLGATWERRTAALEAAAKAAVDVAEAKSATTCEYCGGAGRQCGPHWSIDTLCDGCDGKFNGPRQPDATTIASSDAK